jgi:DNA processing protein
LSAALTDAERRDWLRLARTDNVGPVAFEQLIARFGTARRALEEIPAMAQRGGRALTVPNAARIEDEIAAGQALGARP